MTQDNFMFLISLADKNVSIVGLDSNLRASAIYFTTPPSYPLSLYTPQLGIAW